MKHVLIALVVLAGISVTVACTIFLVRQHREVTVMRQFTAAGPTSLAREEVLDRQAGMALGPEEMQLPLPPPQQNAAPLYSKLTKLLHDKPLGLPKYAEGMDAFHSYTPAQIAAVRRTLAARQDVMTLIHEAAGKPRCVFVRNWGLGVDVPFPEYQPMREAVRLLKTESYLLARDGKYHEAVVNQERGFAIAKHAASDPVLLPYLVGIACGQLTLSGMQSILALAGPNRAIDTEVQSSVAAHQPQLSLRRALAGESGFGCTCMIKMHKAEGQGIYAAFTAAGFPQETQSKTADPPLETQDLHRLIDAWQADYLTHMRVLVTACDLPLSQRSAAFAAADKQLEQEGENTSNPTHLITIILMPVITKMGQNPIRMQSRLQVTQAAALVLEKKAQTGAFPAALPTVFLDPFTNKPFGYRREGANGFIVYSAGSSGTYAGSKPGAKVPPGDSEFRYPPVPLPVPPGVL